MWGGGGGREDRGVGVRGGGRRRAACARGALSVQGGSPILVLVLGLLACLLLEGGLGCLLLFVPKGRGGDERGSGSKRKKERAKRGVAFFRLRTGSAPCLFLARMQRGNRTVSNAATGSEASTARWSGVSKLALRLIPASSWPASIRNSCLHRRGW